MNFLAKPRSTTTKSPMKSNNGNNNEKFVNSFLQQCTSRYEYTAQNVLIYHLSDRSITMRPFALTRIWIFPPAPNALPLHHNGGWLSQNSICLIFVVIGCWYSMPFDSVRNPMLLTLGIKLLCCWLGMCERPKPESTALHCWWCYNEGRQIWHLV